MRSTVLVLDSIVYVPALLMFIKTWQESRSLRTQVRPLKKLHHLFLLTDVLAASGSIGSFIPARITPGRLWTFSIQLSNVR
jgi:hypothetical protein